jgi:hypothetical protein
MKTFAQAAGLPGFAQSKTYAAHRVWKGSTTADIKTHPLSRKECYRLFADAERFEEQTKRHRMSRYAKGKLSLREGALGQAGLRVLYVLLFRFLNHATGRLDPSYESIARKAGLGIATVGRALARLKAAGVLNWIPRCEKGEGPEGGFLLRQISNLYAVVSSISWRGYRRPPDPPPPHPDTWGATPSLPQLGLEAGQSAQQRQTILEGSPPGSLGEALARAGRRLKP